MNRFKHLLFFEDSMDGRDYAKLSSLVWQDDIIVSYKFPDDGYLVVFHAKKCPKKTTIKVPTREDAENIVDEEITKLMEEYWERNPQEAPEWFLEEGAVA